MIDMMRNEHGELVPYVAPAPGSTPRFLRVVRPDGGECDLDIDERVDTRNGFGALEAFCESEPDLAKVAKQWWWPRWREVCHLEMFHRVAPRGWRVVAIER